jgi:hypothetical protein
MSIAAGVVGDGLAIATGTLVNMATQRRRAAAGDSSQHGELIVRLPDGSQLAIPEWMLKPETCEDLKLEAKPRISVSSLLNVRKLIGGDEAHGCAESASGGQDAQQGESDHTTAQASFGKRRALGQTARVRSGALSKSLEGTAGECCE